MPWAAQHGTAIVVHSGLARGALAGKRTFGVEFGPADTRNQSRYFSSTGQAQKELLLQTLAQVAEKNAKSCAAVALRWILDDGRVTSVLAGIKSRAQLQENLAALDWRLSPEDRDALARRSDAVPGSASGVMARKGAT